MGKYPMDMGAVGTDVLDQVAIRLVVNSEWSTTQKSRVRLIEVNTRTRALPSRLRVLDQEVGSWRSGDFVGFVGGACGVPRARDAPSGDCREFAGGC